MTASRPTEQRNPATHDIDVVSTEEMVAMILREEQVAVTATRDASAQIAALVDLTSERILAGGKLHYFGAGASGRLAVLDATELTPTFGVERGLAVAHFPGGVSALLDSTIDLEDGLDIGVQDAADVTALDVVIGITASGTTRYVEGALAEARRLGATTALITSNPQAPLARLADATVVLDTGPEALTGSTRLKAGTATKLALNALSTSVMIRLGRTYSNLMIGMSVTNEKLRERAVLLLKEATGESEEACQRALRAADQDIPRALVVMLSGVDAGRAREALAEHRTARAAVSALIQGAA